jgi:hypothetical protein
MMSRDWSVGMVTGYGLDSRGLILSRGKDFSLLHNIQTGSGAHKVSYPMSTGGSLPRGKAAGTWSWPLTSV